MSTTDWVVFAANKNIEWLALIALPLLACAVHAQAPGVDCVPIQGQGWQGCAPMGNNNAPQTHWEDRWGAIATDADKAVLTTATNAATRDSAERSVMADCKAKGGTQCKLQISYRNECTVMIMGTKSFNIAGGATINDAVQKATKVCNEADTNCHVYYSGCSLPTIVQ